MATEAQIATVAKHFLIAAIWADCEEGTHPRAPKATEAKAVVLCRKFIEENETLFNSAMERGEHGYGSHPDAGSPEAAFGHDLWLTRQGHGVGFWDRDELGKQLGVDLSEACKRAGETYFEFYRGWLYIID